MGRRSLSPVEELGEARGTVWTDDDLFERTDTSAFSIADLHHLLE